MTGLRRWLPWGESLALLLVLMAVFAWRVPDIGFHPDESQRIAESRMWEAFLEGEPRARVFAPRFYTRTVMPVPQYLAGIGRRVGGFRTDQLNRSWEFRMPEEYNRSRGAVPSDALLNWARLPSALLAGVSGLALFALACALAGRVAGYAALALFVVNPYVALVLCRAMSESPLVAFTLLSGLAAIRGLRSARALDLGPYAGRSAWLRPWLWLVLAGVLGGAAGASKLNGLAAGLAVGLLALLPPLVNAPRAQVRSARLALAASVSSLLATALTFLALNPYLWIHSLRRLAELIPSLLVSFYNLDESKGVIADGRHLEVVSGTVLEGSAGLSFDGALWPNAVLTAVGVAFLVRGTRAWLRGREQSPAPAVVLVLATATALPPLLSPLDWSRYFILPVVWSTLAIGVAFAWGGAAARELVQARREGAASAPTAR